MESQYVLVFLFLIFVFNIFYIFLQKKLIFMKKYNLYENLLDKTWFDSSNIIYSECDDLENSLKVVRVYFTSGRVYEYYDVNVNDYISFREAISQGKAFNTYLKKYSCKRLDDVDINLITDKMKDAILSDIKIKNISAKLNDESIEIIKSDDSCLMENDIVNINKESLDDIIKILNVVGIKIIKL